MASWLVLQHLLLSQTAFRRDIDDPKTILDVVETIQSPERLKLLLVLTVADMRAVSSRGSGMAGRPPCCESFMPAWPRC